MVPTYYQLCTKEGNVFTIELNSVCSWGQMERGPSLAEVGYEFPQQRLGVGPPPPDQG